MGFNKYVYSCDHQSICRTFPSPKEVSSCSFAVTSLPHRQINHYSDMNHCSLILSIVEIHIMEPCSKHSFASGFFSTKYSQNILLLSSMQLHVQIVYNFHQQVVFHCMYISEFIYSLLDGYLYFFQILVLNREAMKFLHTFFCRHRFLFLIGKN